MNYIYKILVADDEPQMNATVNVYKKLLKHRYNLDVEFKVINTEAEYDETESFDILMVDYNLARGFYDHSEKVLGDEFIKKFRSKNSISLVIFYSSEFEYNEKDGHYVFPYAKKEIYELINDLRVDKISSRNNSDMMINVIKQCCEELDVFALIISKQVQKYLDNDIEATFTLNDGSEISLLNLLHELKIDSDKGRDFRKSVLETVFTTILNIKY
ncbi:MAG: hypothetical protein K0S34_423 [Bacillales bacterium]|jgi:hypothetical protein|nr:hypothetical protein [Bacillales bacterium]